MLQINGKISTNNAKERDKQLKENISSLLEHRAKGRKENIPSKFHREGTLPCCPILITTMPNISFVPPLHALPAFIQVNLPDIWTMTHLIKQPMLIDSGGAHQGEPENSISWNSSIEASIDNQQAIQEHPVELIDGGATHQDEPESWPSLIHKETQVSTWL